MVCFEGNIAPTITSCMLHGLSSLLLLYHQYLLTNMGDMNYSFE